MLGSVCMRALKCFIAFIAMSCSLYFIYASCKYYDYTSDDYVFLKSDYKERLNSELKPSEEIIYQPKIWFDVLFNVNYKVYNLVFYLFAFSFIFAFNLVIIIMTRAFRDPIYIALMQYEDVITFISASAIVAVILCGFSVWGYNHYFLNQNRVFEYNNAIVEEVK